MNTTANAFELPDLVEEDAPPADQAGLDAWIDYQLERIAHAREEIARNVDVANRRTEIIDRWCADENAVLERRIDYIAQRIQAHTLAYDFGDKKSRKLPHGEIGKRKHPSKLEIADKAAAVAFSKTHDIPLRVKEEPDARELKAYAESSGITPDGCTLIDARDEFFVKAGA